MPSRSLKPAMDEAGLGGDRLLAGDQGQILDRRLGFLGVRDRFADTHVQDDLVQLGDLHLVGVAELAFIAARMRARYSDFSRGS
jgi:hypothetical protein